MIKYNKKKLLTVAVQLAGIALLVGADLLIKKIVLDNIDLYEKVDFIEIGVKERYCFIPYEDECFYDTDCIYYHHHANCIGRCGTDSMFIFNGYNFFDNIEDVKQYYKKLGVTRVWTPWDIMQNIDEITEENINYI